MSEPLPADELDARRPRAGGGGLRSILGRIHPGVEFGLVLAIAFGPFVWSQGLEDGPAPVLVLDDSWLFGVVTYELVIGGAVLAFLRLRGHPLRAWAPKPGVAATLHGIALYLVFVLLYVGLYACTAAIMGEASTRPPQWSGSVSRLALLLLCIVNPLFEEFFAGAYVITSLQRFGAVVAIGTSTLVRVSYHAYQGVPGVIGMVAFAVPLGWYYWRRRNLFALVVAHALGDLVPFLG